MKLYTEEQVKSMLTRAKIFNGQVGDNFIFIYSEEGILESYTPIELPTDEEIEAFSMGYYNGEGHEYYVNIGIEWVIEQIKNQQK